jgi:CBS domain-containing protein
MTTTPAASAPLAGSARTLHLSELLRRPLTDRGGESIGKLSDVIVRLRGTEYPLVTGLVATVGGREVFVPIEQVASLDSEEIRLTSAKLDLRSFERREGEVLLRRDVLGHRLIDVESAHLIKAADLELQQHGDDWVLVGVDTRRRSRRLFGARLPVGPDSGDHAFREWSKFEPLIGHTGSALLRGPFARIRRLKPAQIADLIEELDEDLATRLLGARTDAEIAEVLSRMRADDAADTIAELPQPRRQPVLDLLPPGQRTKVLTLMGFNPTSAGGLMGVDFVSVGAGARVRDALDAVARAATLQPEALTSVHCIDERGRLSGVAKLVSLVQSDRETAVSDIYDDDPVRVGADTDVVDVAVLMSDYNLITIPVVDERRKMMGVITVDDVLEVTLPDDWRRREAAQPPDAHHGEAT